MSTRVGLIWVAGVAVSAVLAHGRTPELIGKEVSSYQRLEDGYEFELPLKELVARGEALFRAQLTPAEGAGRPFTNGVFFLRETECFFLADCTSPLIFPRNFNRISAMDANSCEGCHNTPFGITGGGGDFSSVVWGGATRFDFATFDHDDLTPGRGALDEAGNFVTLDTIGNLRASLGLFGSGYIEMLARQMSADLRAIRDRTGPGESNLLTTKGVAFGTIRRLADGTWDVSGVEGLPAQSLAGDPPSLLILPFTQGGGFVSLRHITAGAFNNHLGMQAAEITGPDDLDGDGVVNELTRADITAAVIFQATLPPPIQAEASDSEVGAAIEQGQLLFDQIGCTRCHVPELPLVDGGWIFTEPGPYNPSGILQAGDAPTLSVDLTSNQLPGKRLRARDGVVMVPAYTDLKLHDITSGPDDPNAEADGNRQFLTKKLWGAANERPYFHHGKFTTLREATLAHAGEAEAAKVSFLTLTSREQDYVIEFLKSLQVPEPDDMD